MCADGSVTEKKMVERKKGGSTRTFFFSFFFGETHILVLKVLKNPSTVADMLRSEMAGEKVEKITGRENLQWKWG